MEAVWGVDLHNGTETTRHIRGKYATDLFTDAALNIIRNHSNAQPLFLFVSHLACHVGNKFKTLQAPLDVVAKFQHIKDKERRTFAGMMYKLDESIGRIVEGLHHKNMLGNSIIIFISDNGGDPIGIRGERSNNWPLKSVKFHLWEGGVRVPAIIWSPLLKLREPEVYSRLMHVSDWLPTLYSAAGGRVEDLGIIDGVDMWEHFIKGHSSSRKEILLNIDQIDGTAAIIKGPYKLIVGQYPEERNAWYGYSGIENKTVESMDDWVWQHGNSVKGILEELGFWLPKVPNQWREGLRVYCEGKHGLIACDPVKAPCLYNIDNDPCEYKNLANQYPEVVERLLQRIEEHNLTAVAPQFFPVDPRGDPRCHGFSFVPWLDEDFKNDCPYF